MHHCEHVAIANLEHRPECNHRAYLDRDDHWNGWICPYFEKSEIERMTALLPEFDDGLVYASEAIRSPRRTAQIILAFPGADVDTMHLYPIGTRFRTWVIVEGLSPAAGLPDDRKQTGAIE
jgi:hypothetical protein